MSVTDSAGAGAAPRFGKQFNPLIFRDSLQVSRWPMMAGTTEGNFPNMVPRATMGVTHTDMSDEGGAQASGQFIVVNSPSGNFPSGLLTACDLLFRSRFPGKVPTQFFSSSAATPVYAFTLAMVNAFLRLQYATAAGRVVASQGLGAGQPITPNDMQRHLFGNVLAASVPHEYDIVEYGLRLSSNPMPGGPTTVIAAPLGNALDDNERLDLHYLFPFGVQRRLAYLGVSMAQSNTLYSPGPPELTSLSAETGQTLLTAMFRGPAMVRNFWGPKATMGKHLWIVCRPNADGVPQIMPYVSDAYDNGLDSSARTYVNAVGKKQYAPCMYIGQVLIIAGNKLLAEDVYNTAAGLGIGSTRAALSQAFSIAEQLPILTIMVHPARWGAYDLKTN